MKLKLFKCYGIPSFCNKDFDMIASDFILLTIELVSPSQILDSSPCHWMFKFKNDTPSLDVSIDSETGLLKEIIIFIDVENVQRKNGEISMVSEQGYPSFSTDIWEENEYYILTSGEIDIHLFETDFQVLLRNSIITKVIEVNEGLDILLDNDHVFAGFIIHGISEDERNLILDTKK